MNNGRERQEAQLSRCMANVERFLRDKHMQPPIVIV